MAEDVIFVRQGEEPTALAVAPYEAGNLAMLSPDPWVDPGLISIRLLVGPAMRCAVSC